MDDIGTFSISCVVVRPTSRATVRRDRCRVNALVPAQMGDRSDLVALRVYEVEESALVPLPTTRWCRRGPRAVALPRAGPPHRQLVGGVPLQRSPGRAHGARRAEITRRVGADEQSVASSGEGLRGGLAHGDGRDARP